MLRFRTSVGTLLAIAALAIATTGNTQERARGGRGQAVPGKEAPHPPKVDAEAPEFELMNLKNEPISLRKLSKNGPVVLLVLRGWPEYQCPVCSRQVAEFLSKKAELKKAGAQVVMIYPGPAALLAEHAKEFQGEIELPDHFHFLIDPDYTFTNAWGLRWEAPRETAYPSTFIVGADNKVKFGLTSTSHRGRESAANVLEELAKLQ
ncbi:Redoxin [Novipirellula aureliae]|uniref:Redoxin n=1 Tax=Novipirellula aureliae TaxID=2527966 RepID=A0A5C6DHN9_9BACT|nr:peroxiredoxin-like family protein [Novipirellula aureliae]TWU35357.1 Redoxin [Novipirellula aureliae]